MSSSGAPWGRGVHDLTTVRDDRRSTAEPYREGTAMSSEAVAGPTGLPARRTDGVTRIPFRRTIPALLTDPLAALREVSRTAGDSIVRVDLGLFRPYLIGSPEQVQHVLVDNGPNYVRDGMVWDSVRRLVGNRLSGEGELHAASRGMVQPVFSAKNVNRMVGLMAAGIAGTVDELDGPARSGEPVDAGPLMARLVHRAGVRALTGDRISLSDVDRLGVAITHTFTSLGARMLLPFVPYRVPLPGDRALRMALSTAESVLYPAIRRCRAENEATGDVVSLLCRARDEHGERLTDRQVWEDLFGIFIASSETSEVALTWLWDVLETHTGVADRLAEEVTRVVGTERPGPEHLAELTYTRMVLQELLRLYPPAWLVPRTAQRADVIGGVPVKAGATVMLSPYVTHRLPELWERPEEFDPGRFAPELVRGRPRFAYWPFGGGVHQCLGQHVFTVEAQLIVAALVSRYRISRYGESARPRAAVTLRPNRPMRIVLRSRES
jgi:cytochrome P450